MSYYSRRNRDAQAAPPAAASKKVPIEKSQQLLKSLLRESDNKVCADCKTATHPRWASWNLGCFICIRCSGIHRGMGTHISRVKSVDLDAWTEEQLASMMKWGNTRCNVFWEAKLPKGHVPDDNKIENFIRTKYDMKKWAASTTVPDPDTLGGASHAAPAAPVKAPPKDNKIAGPPQVAKKAPATQQSSLIGLDFDEPQQSKPVQQQPQQAQKNDDFLSFAQSPPQTQQQQPQQHQQSPPQQQFQQQQPFPTASAPDSSRPDLKKSILSLYANSRQAPVVQQQQQQQQYQQQQFQAQQQFQQQQPQFQQQQGGDFGGFGMQQQPNSGFGNAQQGNSFGGFAQQQNNAHNDWTDAAAPKKQEDDVFANVWK